MNKESIYLNIKWIKKVAVWIESESEQRKYLFAYKVNVNKESEW